MHFKISYRKAAAVLAKHPTKLTSGKEARKLVILAISCVSTQHFSRVSYSGLWLRNLKHCDSVYRKIKSILLR